MTPANGADKPSREAEFNAFWAQFITAVLGNDRNKIADSIQFPVRDWSIEKNHNVETVSIKEKREFLSKYDLYFTPFMRSNVLKAKPQRVDDTHYVVIWQDANAEFSFEIWAGDSGFRLTSYDIGPL